MTRKEFSFLVIIAAQNLVHKATVNAMGWAWIYIKNPYFMHTSLTYVNMVFFITNQFVTNRWLTAILLSLSTKDWLFLKETLWCSFLVFQHIISREKKKKTIHNSRFLVGNQSKPILKSLKFRVSVLQTESWYS